MIFLTDPKTEWELLYLLSFLGMFYPHNPLGMSAQHESSENRVPAPNIPYVNVPFAIVTCCSGHCNCNSFPTHTTLINPTPFSGKIK